MDTNWFTVPLIVSLLAIWIAYENYRRNNYAMIRVRACSCSYTQDVRENGDNMFAHLRAVIQNVGIPLHNIHMTLSFQCDDGGRYSFPLQGRQGTSREGQFAKGMMTEFSLKSHKLDPQDLHFLLQLVDPARQAATLTLYADGYWVWECRLDGFWMPLKRVWNRLAGKVNHRVRRKVRATDGGKESMKTYAPLGTFQLPAQSVLRFADYLRRQANPSPVTGDPVASERAAALAPVDLPGSGGGPTPN